MIKFTMTAGDRPKVKCTLTANVTDDAIDLTAGAVPDTDPVDLTGCAVALLFQGAGASFNSPATILDAPNGVVQYQFALIETQTPGVYQAQWQITDGSGSGATPSGVVTTACPFEFEIRPALPVPEVTQYTKLADLVDDVRAMTGDFDKRIYQDSAIISVMRTQLNFGRVTDGCGKRWSQAGGVYLNPPILSTDIQAYSLLVYYTALTLMTPNTAAYSYRTRAMSERFGEARDLLAEMKNALYEIESGNQTWANITGLRSWLFAVNGIWVWSYTQAEDNIDLSFH